MLKVVYRAEIFEEGDQYVGLSPDLNVSSFGDTPQEAEKALQEAVEGFLEECELLGTLEEVLVESGFIREADAWRLGDRISEEKTAIVP